MSDVTRPHAPRLFLVDGYALIYRAFFALMTRPLQTSRGENTSAAWGVANFLKRLIATHQPELLAWVHDSGATFRDDLYPDYKATREKLSDELQADFNRGLERITQLLAAYHIPILAVPGFEADDVIGTLAQKGVDAGYNVVIVSGDKDFQQLVRPGVWLLNPGRGGPASVEESWVGVENGSDRLGVPPERVIDYLALVGDSSDNVPGVKGIGEKTAQELIGQFGALEDILAHAGEITKKRPREALLEHADMARLSKQLVTIDCDVPVAFDITSLKVDAPDPLALRQLYLELEFTSLLKDVAHAEGAPSPTPAGSAAAPVAQLSTSAPSITSTVDHPLPPSVRVSASGVTVLADATYVVVDNVAAVQHVVDRARATGMLAIHPLTITDRDAPFATDPLRAHLVGLAIAVAPGEAYYLPFAHRADDGGGNLALLSGEGGLVGRRISAGASEPHNLPTIASDDLAVLRDALADDTMAKCGHHAKYAMLVLRGSGVALRGVTFDTMLASYVLDPGRRAHTLELLALDMVGHPMISFEQLCGKGRAQLTTDVMPVDIACDYACEMADVMLRVRALTAPQLVAHDLLPLMDEMEVPLLEVLAEMEWTGIAIDVEWFASLKTRFQAEREQIEHAIYSEAGESFNINSNPQLRKILFEKLGLPVKKKTATGPSTDASVLQELADEGHTLPTLLMEYREIFKLEGTYIDALPRMVNPRDNRLHTSYQQTVAATGRLSSADPNLQNIPIRRELGREIRRGFVARDGWQLLTADYSQIELRLLAHLSADPAFVSAFRAGGDIHRQTAAIIFGVDLADVNSEMRARAKTINFATIYGQGAHALSRQLKITNAEAKAFIETYFARFAGVKAFLEQCVADAKQRGYAETLFKRRRYIPELKERNFNMRAFGERVAANAPIQGSAADLIKLAMIRVQRAIEADRLASRMLLQVHDELVFEIAPQEDAAMTALVKREMEGAATLSVPLLVDIGTGRDWMAAKS
ncbi:MAG: DNA polymerase I [Gemmatimonadaceae bacterium]|nr:DNA polymerase I [Gemmatimonadaceae bacterium]